MASPASAPEYYSVALLGSSGGGTATLGHTDPIELLTTIHRELLRVRDTDDDRCRSPGRVCIGISHAIFVSLCDGSGFDSVSEEEWFPRNDDDGREENAGPIAALYAVGFVRDESSGAWRCPQRRPFRVSILERGPLKKINTLARTLDGILAQTIRRCHSSTQKCSPSIAALISLSSEPTIIHAASLGVCQSLKEIDFPIVGSGGTSLSRIASLYDLRIVGNSGGSVASTTLTKARGWARGLAREWGMAYDATLEPENGSAANGKAEVHADAQTNEASTPIPTLKSILEAALPSFLFVCLALRLLNAWGDDATEVVCLEAEWMVQFALRHIVLGTTCCILAATSRSSSSPASSSSDTNQPSEDQSTLLMSAAVAGVIASASASQSAFSSSYGGGSALAGLVAGALITKALAQTSQLCHRYNVTATMTNILCGGGVGMMIGMLMHLSGLAHGLSLITGAIKSLIRWRKFVIPDTEMQSCGISSLLPRVLVRGVFPAVQYLQERWSDLISQSPAVLRELPILQARDGGCSVELLPVPTGLGFLYGCFFVYGSKIGLYHSLFLPAILLEMDFASAGEEASLLGAIDECTLALVCAGICAGNLLLPPSTKKSDSGRKTTGGGLASLSWQALKTNILCGDFIEAAYPSMERSRLINGAAYLAAGLSTEIVLQRRVLSSAYLPLPLAIWISNDRTGMNIACCIAFAVSLLGTVVSNATMRARPPM